MTRLGPTAVVERRVRRVFGQLSRAEFDPILAQTSDDVLHSFPGHHGLAGSRRGKPAFAAWLDRLHRLFPTHHFEVIDVVCAGPLWNLRVAARWRARLEPQVGEPYENEGVHWIRLRWGTLTELHAYLDSQAVATACDAMAAAGIEEASARRTQRS